MSQPDHYATLAAFVAHGLSRPMRAALRRRQADLFGAGAVVTGNSKVVRALARRGLVEIGRDAARVTELGGHVIRAAGLTPIASTNPQQGGHHE